MWLSESQSPSLHIRSCPLSSLSLSCSSPRACYRDNGCSSRAHPTGTLRAPGLQSTSAPPLCPEEQTALLPQGLCTCQFLGQGGAFKLHPFRRTSLITWSNPSLLFLIKAHHLCPSHMFSQLGLRSWRVFTSSSADQGSYSSVFL